MNIAAFDLMSHTGVAYELDTQRSSMVWDCTQTKIEPDGTRFHKFQMLLKDLLDLYTFDIIAYELCLGHANTLAAHYYGGFLSVLQIAAIQQKIPIFGVPASTLKKFVTGNGKATKEDMITAALEQYQWEPTTYHKTKTGKVPDDNEADAVCILEWIKANPKGLILQNKRKKRS